MNKQKQLQSTSSKYESFTNLRTIVFFVFCLYFGDMSFAQNIAINTSGNPANSSAGLDIEFTDKGVLIPRVALQSLTDNTTIASPATSLLVYSSGGVIADGYYYNSGTPASPVWSSFITSASNSGCGQILYPDGTANITPITYNIISSGPYTVPPGKNLYITSYINGGGAAALAINGIAITAGQWNRSPHRSLSMPIIVGPGEIVSGGIFYSIFNGFLVTKTVTPITFSLGSGTYTVPAGKNLFITNYYANSGASDLMVNGIIVYNGISSNVEGVTTFEQPLIVGSGGTVSNSLPAGSFNGYVK